MDECRQVFGPWQRTRIDHERPEVALLVEEIQVGVIVRDEPADVRCDSRAQRREVTLTDEGVRDLDQRSPVIALRLELVGGLT
jgi:hypothetical protein